MKKRAVGPFQTGEKPWRTIDTLVIFETSQ